MRPEFERQNAKGREAEERVAHILLAAGWKVQWRHAFHRRDIIADSPKDGEPQRIEVKCEDEFASSKNACIELGQRGVPSGLMTSESTVCLHTFGNACLVYRTQPMRLWLHDQLCKRTFIVRSFGDNDNCGVLVPKLMLATKWWADMTTMAAFPCSKVFRGIAPLRVAQ